MRSQNRQHLKSKNLHWCTDNPKKLCTKLISVQPRFVDIINNFSTSAYGEIYLLSYKMFTNNPITGVGLSTFKYLCENQSIYKDMMNNYNCASHPHNIYIQWLAETGVVVFMLFIVYLFVVINFIIKNEGDKEFKILSLVLMLIMFWPMMSTGSLIKNWYGISVFYTIGICLCLSRIKSNN